MSDVIEPPRRPLKPEILLIEWKKGDKWFGTTDEKRVGKLREPTERYLMESANRYYYPDEYQGMIRLSYPDK